jgi:erythromycin esterase-like protein
LGPRLDGVRVVGLGEGAHGTHAFQQAHAFVTPFLAARGFGVVLAEMQIGSASPIAAFVAGEEDVDVAAALDEGGTSATS